MSKKALQLSARERILGGDDDVGTRTIGLTKRYEKICRRREDASRCCDGNSGQNEVNVAEVETDQVINGDHPKSSEKRCASGDVSLVDFGFERTSRLERVCLATEPGW